MKKLVIFTILLSIMTLALFGCGAPKHFSGEWKFSKISSVEVTSNVHESWLIRFEEEYGAKDQASINAAALDALSKDGIFAPYYVNFTRKYTYTYDPIMEREATWCFFQTGDNTGFISFYTELDIEQGNPDPSIFPEIAYNAEADVLFVTLYHVGFTVTLELTR